MTIPKIDYDTKIVEAEHKLAAALKVAANRSATWVQRYSVPEEIRQTIDALRAAKKLALHSRVSS